MRRRIDAGCGWTWMAAVLVLAGSAAPAQEHEAARIEADTTEQVVPGVTHRSLRFSRGGSLFSVHVVEADPTHPAINILPVRAHDRAIGKETVRSMATRFDAAAAVNGGYFEVPGLYAGTSNGVYLLKGEALTSGANRSALVLCRETDFRERAEIDVVNFYGKVTAPDGSSFKIANLNRPRRPGELVIYSAMLGATTRTSDGLEATVDADGRVRAIRRTSGDSPIPRNGYVLSASGEASAWLGKYASEGVRLRIEARLDPLSRGKNRCKAEDIIGAGPRLVERGRVNVTDERFGHAAARHPRTAFAVTGRGTFLFLTVDGRQASSAGMTLKELAEELVGLGAVEAINLDGGGSTTIVVNGTVRNSPSDGQERPVSDGLLVFSIPDLTALGALVEKLAPGQIEGAFAAQLRSALAGSGGSRKKLEAVRKMVRRADAGQISPQAARLILEAAGSLSGR